MRVRTPDGVGVVTGLPQVVRGRTSYFVKGSAFEGWYDDQDVYKLSDFSEPPPQGPAQLLGDFSDIPMDPDTERDNHMMDLAELPWDDIQQNTGDPTSSTLIQDETDAEDTLHYDEDRGSDLPHSGIPAQAFTQSRTPLTHSATNQSHGRSIGHLRLAEDVDTDKELDTGIGSSDMSGTHDDSFGPMAFDDISEQSGFEGDLDVSSLPSSSPTPGTGKSFEDYTGDDRGGDFLPKTTSLVDPLAFLNKIADEGKPGYSKRRNPLGDTPFDRQQDYQTDESPWFMKNRLEDQPCSNCGAEGPHAGENCESCGSFLIRKGSHEDDDDNKRYRHTPGYFYGNGDDSDSDSDDSSSESSDGSDGSGDSSGGGDGGSGGGGSHSAKVEAGVGQKYKRTRGPKKSQPLGTHPLEKAPEQPSKNKRIERGIKGEEASKPTRGRRRKTPAQPKGTHFGAFDLHFAANLCSCSFAPLHSKSEHLEILSHCGAPGCPRCGGPGEEGTMCPSCAQEFQGEYKTSTRKRALEKGPEFSGSAEVDFADRGVTPMDGLSADEIADKYPGLAGRGIPEDPDSGDDNLNMAHLDQILTSTKKRSASRRPMNPEPVHPHEEWNQLADELNDYGVDMTTDDFQPDFVAKAKQQSQEHGLPWPPRTGDFDRWYAGEFGVPLSRDRRFESKTAADPSNGGRAPQSMPAGGLQQQQMQIEMQVEQLMKFWAVDNFGWWHWTGSQQDLAMLNQMQQSMMPVMQPTMEPQGVQQEPGSIPSPMGPLASQSSRRDLPKGKKS